MQTSVYPHGVFRAWRAGAGPDAAQVDYAPRSRLPHRALKETAGRRLTASHGFAPGSHSALLQLRKRKHLLDPLQRVACLLFTELLERPAALDVVERDPLRSGVIGPKIMAVGEEQPSLPV